MAFLVITSEKWNESRKQFYKTKLTLIYILLYFLFLPLCLFICEKGNAPLLTEVVYMLTTCIIIGMFQPPWDIDVGNKFIIHYTYACDYNLKVS